MNELKIPIQNAYVYTYHKYCYTLMEGMHIQITPWHNERGYTFMSSPCFCYSTCAKDIKNNYCDFKDNPIDLLLSQKRLAFLNKVIVDRDFSSCVGCPKFAMRDDSGFWYEDDFKFLFGEKTGTLHFDMFKNRHISTVFPRGLFLNLGSCCNLKCRTCRNDFITKHWDLTDDEINQFAYIARHCDLLALGGDGEFFMNPNYTRILNQDLRSDSQLCKIMIMTNGTMFTEKRWNLLPDTSKSLIHEIKITLDAATPETYEKVRGPVGWKMLMKNMPFILDLKKQYGFELASTYTISKYNVQDVEKFYDFARGLGFDNVMFQFARDLFHPETGKGEDFKLPDDKRNEIMNYLLKRREQEGFARLVIE